jgi:hypothetical protein
MSVPVRSLLGSHDALLSILFSPWSGVLVISRPLRGGCPAFALAGAIRSRYRSAGEMPVSHLSIESRWNALYAGS